LKNESLRLWLIGSPEDVSALQSSFAEEPWSSRLLLFATSDVMSLFEAASRVRLMVSVDTALVHIASALRLPLIALYSFHKAEWHPRSNNAVTVYANENIVENMSEFDTQKLTEVINVVVAHQIKS
jgi:ADP-heptose:LPS heptosyltransferase